jgi:tetratricopeptide (TPR) repeat protein
VLVLLWANSLWVTLPWIAVLLRRPFRNRPAFFSGAGLLLAAALAMPIWEGVHWGPRLLLFAVPLLLIDLYQSNRARGITFWVVLGVTAVQSLGSGVLVYARSREVSDRAALLESKMGNPVICPTMSQCVDLASLWRRREFFTAANTRELKQLLIELRFQKTDTVWLHLTADDSLYLDAFPDGKPVCSQRVTEIRAGSLYQTHWRVYELAMNREDSLWAGILEQEAGRLLEKQPEEALRLEQEAVNVSPGSAQTHHNLAVILAQTGRMDEARREAQRAAELNPELVQPRRLLEILDAQTPAGP